VGETFPTRAFPNTDYRLAGVFMQDEIAFLDGAIRLYPALRYDYYDLSPDADLLFPGATAGQSDAHVTPKFGAVVWPTERLGLFVNYAQGFKAPSPSQVNNGFANPVLNYVSIPNPDLAPETSESLEGGVRLRETSFAGARWQASAVAFVGAYEDFIEQIMLSGNFEPPPAAPTVFQYVNLGSVEISGFEARFEGTWESGFGATLSLASARGSQKTDGVVAPLQSVEPFKLVVGLGYDDPQGRFGGQVIVTHSAGKDAARSGCASPCFLAPDFTILDLTAYWGVTENARLRVGVFNATDETYWWWSDVRGLAAGSPIADAFTQPGRNVSASLSYRF
jgi:hemoglobin/transferrin/lactoferrin receptor protein